MARNTRRTAVKKPISSYVRTILLAVTIVVVIYAIVFVATHRPPNITPLLDDASADALLKAARQALAMQPANVNIDGEVAGAIVKIYQRDGKQDGAGCFDADPVIAVVCAARELELSEVEPDHVSIHLLRKLKSVMSSKFREDGFGYSRGLYAVVVTKNDKTRAYAETDLHVRRYSVKTAIKRLRQGKGYAMKGTPPKSGNLLAAVESITDAPDGKAVRLYRASTLLPEIDSDYIMQACRWAGDFLCNLIKPDNTFYYEGDVGRDKYNNRYNLLRHAGTCYSLYQLYRATGESRYRLDTNRAWQWLLRQMRYDTDDQGNTCAFPLEGKKVKLGGAGLTLIALSERLHIEHNDADLTLGRQLANHIMRSQKKDGSFDSYYAYKKKKASRRRSIYYPGEAMLGLMRFYAHDPDQRYVDTVAKAADYLIHERWKILGIELNVPPDAWLTIALNELHKVRPQKDYADYCMKLADGLVNDQILNPWLAPYPDYRGGFFPYPPMVTPAGARNEGMTAAYELGKRAGYDTTDLRHTILESARWQIERLIRPEFEHLYPNPERRLGAFRHSPMSNRIRIDYNQHNISGLLIAAQIMAENE